MYKPTINCTVLLFGISVFLSACGGSSGSSDDAGNSTADASVDTTAPAIALLGNNPIDLMVGASYTDSGATATDNVDGDISANVVTDTSEVNNTVAGSYTVTYTVSDKAGNAATPVTRTVNVIAQTPAPNPTDNPPMVSVSAPANGATVSGTVIISANASDDSAVAGVQFQLDGSNVGAEDTVAPYSISWNTINVPNGSHSITAIARDFINQTGSATVNVTVNNLATPPACSDGADNDGDGLTDFPNDPGCASLTDSDEFNAPNTGNVVLNSVTGTVADGQTLTISGSGFSAKTNEKPLFWWHADLGTTPSSLGRKTAWDVDDNLGTFSTAVVAPGSQTAVARDHGATSGASLSPLYFDSDEIYLYRKTYEDFDITTDEAIRTRVNLISGTLNVGDVITGQTSGATGTIVLANTNSGPSSTHTVNYSNTSGTVGNQPPTNFINGETMTSNAGAVLTNVERNGVFKTFNFKTIRLWAEPDSGLRNNIHLNAQGRNGSRFNITPEATEGTTYSSNFTNQPLYQLPREWKVEELQYKASSINNKDGVFNFYQKGVLGTDNKFRTRTTQYPKRYIRVGQSQVSHNAQPGSVMYYDSVYLDDTWHRVLLCPEATWNARTNCEIQIPTAWNDSGIILSARPGSLGIGSTAYLYVINANNDVNATGYPVIVSN